MKNTPVPIRQSFRPQPVDSEDLPGPLELIGRKFRFTIKSVGHKRTALGDTVVHACHAPGCRCHGIVGIEPIVADECRVPAAELEGGVVRPYRQVGAGSDRANGVLTPMDGEVHGDPARGRQIGLLGMVLTAALRVPEAIGSPASGPPCQATLGARIVVCRAVTKPATGAPALC